MSDRAAMLQDIADTADSLTEPYRHIELLTAWDTNRNKKIKRRIVTFAALLDQLAAAAYPGAGAGEGHGVHESRPPVDMDAVSAHAAISVASARWCWSARIDLRDTVTSNIRALVGTSPNLDSDTQALLLAELRSWHSWASVITGWRTPPYEPPAPCPHCDARGRLRVRLDTQTAACLACHATWTHLTIGVLGRHVEQYREESVRVANEARRLAIETRKRGEGHLLDR